MKFVIVCHRMKNEIKPTAKISSLLLYEPDDGLRESLSMVLKSIYKTYSISYSGQVLKELSKIKSDLLILDVEPGSLENLKIYREIKRISPNTKIISLYVYDEDAENIDSELRKLSNAVLYKPLDINHFLETVKRVNSE